MSWRLFVVAGWRSHRALFRWSRPSAFIPTVLGIPAVQLLWFVHLGRYIGTEPVSYYAVGNSVHGCAMAGLFAPSMSVQGERMAGTLTAVLASPAHRAIMFAGRIIPAVVIGSMTSAIMLGLAVGVAGVDITASALPLLAASVLVTAVSCSACGLVIGGIGLLTREATIIANLVLYTMLLLCGVNVPVSRLPAWLQPLCQVMPMSHGLEAARRSVVGRGGVLGPLALEALVGSGFVVLALVLLHVLERSSRRRATLDTA
jgi:ABC-2 type transport system permease protein